jgi:hypothetical protein
MSKASVNPKLDTLKVVRSEAGGLYFRCGDLPVVIRTDVLSAPLPSSNVNRIKLVKLTPRKNSEFLEYLHDLDDWMNDWVSRYNDRYGTTWTYEQLVQTPMKKVNGKLVVNEEALAKYGQHFVVTVPKNSNDRLSVQIEADGNEETSFSEFDFESYVHHGTQISVIAIPNIWNKDGKLKITLRAKRIKVYDKLCDDIEFDQMVIPQLKEVEL